MTISLSSDGKSCSERDLYLVDTVTTHILESFEVPRK